MPSVDGIISGLNTTEVIEGLLAFQSQPIVRLEERVAATTEKKTAITALSAKTIALQLKVNSLTTESAFNPISVSSSNQNVLAATGSSSLAPGAYRFKVHQLAQSEQYVSSGFSESTSLVGAGTLSVETGNGFVDRQTELSLLNGGRGVRLGSIRVTNTAGLTTTVDLSQVATINEVIDKINSSGISVSARVATSDDSNAGQSFVLTDLAGGGGNLTVTDLTGGTTALDLGIRKTGSGASLQGDSVLVVESGLSLDVLNDNLGVQRRTGDDLSITARDGGSFVVDLSGAKTLGDVITSINTATGNDSVTASIVNDRLTLTDSSTGGNFIVQNNVDSRAATDLGIETAVGGVASGTITGERILADFNSVLLKTLNGGSGIRSGSIEVTARTGSSVTVDLSSATTLNEVLELLNDATTGSASVGVTASIASNGTSIELRDTTAGTGSLSVTSSDTATDLGLVASVTADTLTGTDLNPQYINLATKLSTLNGGRGVFAGKINITDSAGNSFEVNLESATTINDVILNINGRPDNTGAGQVTASLNSKGDGIQLVSAGGTGAIRVSEVSGGTTARDLNFLRDATGDPPLTLDGSFQYDVTLTATDTLDTVAEKINALGISVNASVINDGSFLNPSRLQITGTQTGAGNRVLLNTSGATTLSFGRTSQARDAILFFGSSEGSSQPILVRSRTNKFNDVVEGLSLDARDTSTSEVVVTATQDPSKIKEKIEAIVEEYNGLLDNIRELSRFDPELGVKGELFGDSITRTIERILSGAINRRVGELPAGQNLASNVGIRFLANGKLQFRASEFDKLNDANPEAVRQLFIQKRLLETSTLLADFGNGDGVDTTGLPQLSIKLRDTGSEAFEVDLNGDLTIQDVIRSIETASRTDPADVETERVSVSISTDGRSLVIDDLTTGDDSFNVSAANGSQAFAQLGLNQNVDTSGGGTITGTKVDLKNDSGVALRLAEALGDLLNTTDGSLVLRADFYQDQIEKTNDRIQQKKEILAIREQTLKRQFSQLEVIMARNQNAQARLQAALSSLGSFG